MKTPNECIKDNDIKAALELHNKLVKAGFSASEKRNKLIALSAFDGGFNENAFYALIVNGMKMS